jgi:hypothetical protein
MAKVTKPFVIPEVLPGDIVYAYHGKKLREGGDQQPKVCIVTGVERNGLRLMFLAADSPVAQVQEDVVRHKDDPEVPRLIGIHDDGGDFHVWDVTPHHIPPALRLTAAQVQELLLLREVFSTEIAAYQHDVADAAQAVVA